LKHPKPTFSGKKAILPSFTALFVKAK